MQQPDIQIALEKHIAQYKDSLAQYSDEQFYAKPNDEEWSLGQMYEHVTASSLFFFLKRATYCLEQRNGQIGGEKNESGLNIYKYRSFPPIKIKIPAALSGPAPVAKTRAEYEVIFDQIIAQSREVGPLAAADPGEYKALQPALGWLTAFEWYELLEMHTRHHFRQKAELDTWLGISV